jgi:hypothetical protein
MAKAAFNKKKELVMCYVWSIGFYGADTWTLRIVHYIRSALKLLKRGAGEGWRKSVGPIVGGMKQYYIDSRREEYLTYNT